MSASAFTAASEAAATASEATATASEAAATATTAMSAVSAATATASAATATATAAAISAAEASAIVQEIYNGNYGNMNQGLIDKIEYLFMMFYRSDSNAIMGNYPILQPHFN